MSNQTHQMSGRLWIYCSAAIYLLLMALWPLEGEFPGRPVGVIWPEALANLRNPESLDAIFMLVTVFGGASILLGWILHAVLIVIWPSKQPPDDGSGS